MTDRELMQQALHALELIDEAMPFPVAKLTIKNLRERLAQPEQEPVCDKDPQGCWSVRCQLGKVCKHAAPRQWQGLTEERIEELYSFWIVDCQDIVGFARAIERTFKEKNDGQ